MRARIRHFPLEQCSKIDKNHSETTVPETPGRALQSLWLFGFGRLSHSSADLPLPPSSSSSWATGFSKIQKIQEGQGEKQQPPESSPRVDVSGLTTSQAGENKGPGLHNRPPTPRPWRLRRAPPAPVPPTRPSSGQPRPRGRRGCDESLRRLLASRSVASFVCLIPQQSLSLKLTLI